MQVKLEKRFPIDAPPAQAWRLLSDIKGVAECMPGAEITEQLDANNYKGQVKVKVGPASMHFKGDIEVQGVDAAKREIRLVGKGADVKGTSSATMDLTASVVEADGKAELVGLSAISVTGKMASLGGRMMTQVSDQIIKQFADNFATRVVALGEGEEAQAAAAKAAEQPKEINGLAFVWSVIVGFIKDLFGAGSKQTN